MFAVPVMRYSVAVLDWSTTELNKLDVKFIKLLSMNGAHHFKGDVDHLYLHRDLGGRGFVSLLDLVECEKCSISCYLHSTTETLLWCLRDTLRIPIMSRADDYVAEVCQQKLLQWKDKALHGEFSKKVDSNGALSLSFQLLMYG